MTAYIELHLKGNGRAIIEAGQICGIVTGKGCDIWSIGTPDTPVHVLVRGRTEPLEVIGEMGGKILSRAILSRKKVREESLDAYVDYLEPLGGESGTDAS